ncbi:NTF2 fold immunity protein [Pedobacter sp.]|jgi:hypothetical protein|uniref:NTF2 fold immunity protein n=1 Tax=Pedobacter sp. TaxID=1411316 RepID=UPI002BFF90B1|nr:NTF2 fold immunity protein [Pedobacter sp.]HWW40254.1 NTF2 fold immunity protein [Pedobacter sp.]
MNRFILHFHNSNFCLRKYIQIAQMLFVRVYGEKVLKKKPFVATLKNGNVWVVEGSIDKGVDGGVPHLEMQKSDGKIVDLFHYK